MKKISSAASAYEYVQYLNLGEAQESRVILIYLKEDGTMIGWNDQTENDAMISIGVLVKAKKAILVTNHPSGSSLPSRYDIEQTKKVRELLGAAQIGLVDHIIVGYKEFYSYAEEEIVFVK